MRKALNGFDELSLPDFKDKLDLILNCMTGNANFPDQQTMVQGMATEAAAYKVLDTDAAGRDEEAVIKRNAARTKITTMLHTLGRYVTAVANDDMELLASSGYSYTQDRKATPDMHQPAPLEITLGVNKGELCCKTKAQPGLKSVNFYMTTDPAAATGGAGVVWAVTTWNKVKYTYTNLPGGVRHYFKVGLVGVRGQEVISDVTSFIPQ